MPRFRPRLAPPPSDPTPPDLLAVGQMIDELMQPGHFFVAAGLKLHWTFAKAEEVPWEIFQGNLLPPAQTRQTAKFLAWHVTQEGADTPMLAVRLDPAGRIIHVTRGILCYVWEAHSEPRASASGPAPVIEGREVQRWVTELVGSAELERFPDADELRDELTCLIWQAVVGTSKLPLHSVEAPLPAFSLGQLHYCYRPWAQDTYSPLSTWTQLVEEIERPEFGQRERARVLEAALRQMDFREEIPMMNRLRPDARRALELFRTIFNEVSLSPHTEFPEKLLGIVEYFEMRRVLPTINCASFVAGQLARLVRHLTAYDLKTFHHRGANYPDALFLECLLDGLGRLILSDTAIFIGEDDECRFRRNALRQGLLVRRHYVGHLVPDEPTSPGENARVLPAPHARVPEEQLLHPERRERRLFAIDDQFNWCGHGHPDYVRREKLTTTQAFEDLGHPAERRELGIGLLIDRPLGYEKAPAEPDLTPMLAHEAFSLSIAKRRVGELKQLAAELSLDLPSGLFETIAQELGRDAVRGVPAAMLAEPGRPTASLADVRRVADDFVIVRTMPGGLGEFLSHFDWEPLRQRFDLPFLAEGCRPRVVAMVQTPRGNVLGFFDEDYRVQMELVPDLSAGFFRRAGIELPTAGLRVVAVRGQASSEVLQIMRKP